MVIVSPVTAAALWAVYRWSLRAAMIISTCHTHLNHHLLHHHLLVYCHYDVGLWNSCCHPAKLCAVRVRRYFIELDGEGNTRTVHDLDPMRQCLLPPVYQKIAAKPDKAAAARAVRAPLPGPCTLDSGCGKSTRVGSRSLPSARRRLAASHGVGNRD